MVEAKGKVVAVCYHNGCPAAEKAFEIMKVEYRNLFFYKVNTLNSEDIKNQYADGGPKPYFKFYRNGTFFDEVKYQSKWPNHELVVRESLEKFNG